MILLFSAIALADVAPHASWGSLVSGNGYGVVVFEDDRLAHAYTHVYQAYDAFTYTPEVLFDTYFGVVREGSGSWLTDVSNVGYEPGTGIITSTATAGDLVVSTWSFAPMGLDAFGVAQVATVRNTGASDAELQLVSLHNWHVGGEEHAWSADAEHVGESGSDVSLLTAAPGATDVSCDAVWTAVQEGRTIGGGCDAWGADVVPGVGWRLVVPAGGEVTVGQLTTSGDADAWIAGREPAVWVDDERAWWDAWHAAGVTPAGLSADEAAVFRQQLAFLKMGQSREPGDAYGQIPASMPASAPVGDFRHVWNIAWVRDASYAIAALARTGHVEEAAAALAFMIQEGKTGEYRSYVGDADYAVSVCRIYGDGTEWSDADDTGPNVEFDNFGLFLWVLGEVLDNGGEVDDAAVARALDGVADVLVGLIDPNTGLLLPDSSIWERHWDGNQQQFTYSSAWAVAGLRAAARVADARADTRADTYRDAADRIAAAIPEQLVDAGGVVAASREQLATGGDYLDLAAVEVFNLGIVDARGDTFAASMAAWDRELRVASGNGFHRNDDGSVYDEHEWLVIDLRVAEALRRACRADEAAELERWVTALARANHDTVPELLEPNTGDFAGPAPMLGFGAGAWVLAVAGRDAADAACLAVVDTGTTKDPATGCGCASASPAFAAWSTLAALALVARRRTP